MTFSRSCTLTRRLLDVRLCADVEILTASILASYLGASLEVFTSIIGVVLAGISIGAWLVGRAASRHELDLW